MGVAGEHFWDGRRAAALLTALRETGGRASRRSAPPPVSVSVGALRWLLAEGVANAAHFNSCLTTARANRDLGTALELYREMLSGIAGAPEPTLVTFNVLLSACAASGGEDGADAAVDAHSTMVARGISPDAQTTAALVAALGAADPPRLDAAFAAVAACANPNAYVFSALIAACGRAGDWRRAADVFERAMPAAGVPTTLVCANALINACAKCASKDGGAVWCALQVRDDIIDNEWGFEPDVVTYTSLIETLGACGMLWEAGELIQEMRVRPNARTYVALISACEEHGAWEDAIRWHTHMREAGVAPNVHTFSALVAAYARGGQLDAAMRVPEEMAKAGVAPNRVVFNALIGACENAGDHMRAMGLWAEMRATVLPDLRTYSSLISACEKGNDWRRALLVYDQMRQGNLRPNVFTYSALISALGKGGEYERAREVYGEMRAEGVSPNSVTFGALMDAAAAAGRYEEALELFEELEGLGAEVNVIVLNAVVRALGAARQWDAVDQLIERIRTRHGVSPDAITINTLISCADSVERAFALFARMREESITPDVFTYNALIDACKTHGAVDRAFEVFASMKEAGIEADVVTFNTLIDGAGKTGDWQRALAATRDMRAAGLPPNAITYSALLDALWGGGRRKACAHLVRRLRAQGHSGLGTATVAAGGEALLDLHSLSPGGAQARVIVWLIDEVPQMLASGAACAGRAEERDGHWSGSAAGDAGERGATPDRFVVITGRGRHSREAGTSVLRARVFCMLDTLRSPFSEPADNEGRVEARAADVQDWLAAVDLEGLLVDDSEPAEALVTNN